MKKFLAVTLFVLGGGLVLAQTPIKPTPASETLVATAKALQAEQKSLDTIQQQAANTLKQSQESLQKALTEKQKALEDQLKADKKYAPMMKEIQTILDQMKTATSDAQTAFYKNAGPIAQKTAADKALIDGLVPVVRKENSLPETAQFDPVTQTWKP